MACEVPRHDVITALVPRSRLKDTGHLHDDAVSNLALIPLLHLVKPVKTVVKEYYYKKNNKVYYFLVILCIIKNKKIVEIFRALGEPYDCLR